MLKRHILISVVWVAFFVLCAMPSFAQDLLWCRTYADGGEESGNAVQQTADGGYIIAGWTDSFPIGRVVYLVKLDSLGDTLWARTYSGIYPAEGYSVQQTRDGGYIVAGITVFSNETPAATSVYLVRTDSLGEALWSRTYGVGDYYVGRSVQQTTDGGYIVAGHIYDLYTFLLEVYLIRTDSLGDTLWTRAYGGSDREEGFSVEQTTDGGYVVTGHTESFGAGGSDVYLIKTDAYGDTLWTRTYGGGGGDWGYSVCQTTDGGYIVAGETNSFGAGGNDVFLIKTDSLGDTLWTRTYGGSGSDYASSVRQTADGGYVLAGITSSFGAGGVDFYLVKTDPLGDTLWTRACGGDNHDIAHSVWQTTDGGYVVAGWTMSFGASNHPDVMLVRFDSLGNSCIGEFVSSTVMNVSPAVSSPATEIISPLTIVTAPSVTVTSSVTGINTICERVRGDANGDGVVDLGDIVYLVGYLYKGGPAPDPVEAGDCNCDGIVNLGDVVYLVSYLYKGGPPPGC